ncbi:MAG: hypothetical protein ACRDPY_23735 [Streptosporangiaceae bacterium]
MVASDTLHPLGAHPADGPDLGLDLGIRTGLGDDWLRIGAMKLFADGSLVGRTAAMTADLVVLSDDPTAVSPGSIGGTQVLATFTDGECRFSADGTSMPR